MPAQKLSIIVAMARNRTIGINNTLPWRIPEDLKHFKSLTMGHHIIMGRKTYDSIGRPLPGRVTVVVTRNQELKIASLPQPQGNVPPTGCAVTHSLGEAIEACANDPEIFIAGGAELYAQALPLANMLYITELQHDVEGDAFFPELDPDAWQEIAREKRIQAEPEKLEYHFVIYRRRNEGRVLGKPGNFER